MQSTICVYFCADINLKLFYFIYSKYDRIKKAHSLFSYD